MRTRYITGVCTLGNTQQSETKLDQGLPFAESRSNACSPKCLSSWNHALASALVIGAAPDPSSSDQHGHEDDDVRQAVLRLVRERKACMRTYADVDIAAAALRVRPDVLTASLRLLRKRLAEEQPQLVQQQQQQCRHPPGTGSAAAAPAAPAFVTPPPPTHCTICSRRGCRASITRTRQRTVAADAAPVITCPPRPPRNVQPCVVKVGRRGPTVVGNNVPT